MANSIGAFLSMVSLDEALIDRAYFISPVVDMEKLICNMMMWAEVDYGMIRKGLNYAYKKDKLRYRIRSVDGNPNELPGIKKKSFILPYAGGEIWFEHLDGIYQYAELATQKLRRDTAVFHRPSYPGYITFVLNETIITEELISEIADALIKPGKQFMRVAFVGADRHSSRKLKKILYGHGLIIKFFDGIEPAKEWLLG